MWYNRGMKQKGFSIIAGVLIIAISAVVSFAVTTLNNGESVGGTNFVGGQTYKLSGSGVSSSATSLGLTKFQITQTGQPLLMADFGDAGYGTIEPGNTSKQEFVSWTGITQNSDGTATLTGLSRGLSPISPYTASTTLQYSHSGGSVFVVSNPPQLYDQATFKSNDEAITGDWTFDADNPPALDATGNLATTSASLASKEYVDSVTAQGAATSSESVSGISTLATQI